MKVKCYHINKLGKWWGFLHIRLVFWSSVCSLGKLGMGQGSTMSLVQTPPCTPGMSLTLGASSPGAARSYLLLPPVRMGQMGITTKDILHCTCIITIISLVNLILTHWKLRRIFLGHHYPPSVHSGWMFRWASHNLSLQSFIAAFVSLQGYSAHEQPERAEPQPAGGGSDRAGGRHGRRRERRQWSREERQHGESQPVVAQHHWDAQTTAGAAAVHH